MKDGLEAADSQPRRAVAQPDVEPLTPVERMLIRYYRQLDEGEQEFMRRGIEAMAVRRDLN